MTRSLCAALVVSSLFAAATVLAAPDAHEARVRGQRAIVAADVRADVDFLASDELLGRETPSPGLEVAARYLKTRYERLGLATSFQTYDLARRELVANSALEARVGGKVVATVPLANDRALPVPGAIDGKASGPLVFAGYGISARDRGWDDYDGLDVKGKVVVVLRYGPGHREPGQTEARSDELVRLDERLKERQPFTAKMGEAMRRGAAALLVVSGWRGRADDGFQVSYPVVDDVLYEDANTNEGAAQKGLLPAVHVSRAAAAELLRGRLDLAALEVQLEQTARPASRVIEGLEVHLELARRATRLPAKNVVAVLEGSDPELAREVVVLGAHYDHVGQDADGIYVGADDNASGTAAILGVARGFVAAGRPRRSVAFLSFSGEEINYLGSEHYVRHPPRPLAQHVAMINLDMVGRNAPGKLEVTGGEQAPLLGHLLAEANQDEGTRFALETARNLDSGSDHESFFNRGVPVLFFFSGYHDDYHKPTDRPEKVDAEKVARAARLAFGIAWRLAERPERPRNVRPAVPGKPALY